MKIERRNLVRKKKEEKKAWLLLLEQINKEVKEFVKNNEQTS